MMYRKLVRDNIPAMLESQGKKVSWHVADDEEYRKMLMSKIKEETAEIEEEGAKELADVLEAAMCLAAAYGVEWQEVERIAGEKRASRGSFKNKIILESVE